MGEHFTDFINVQVKTGRYNSASDVVRAALRLLEEREAQIKALNDAIDAGKVSGAAIPFDNEKFVRKMHDKHSQQNLGHI